MKETGQAGYDAVFSGNALHVVSWPEVEAMCSALGNARAGGAVLVAYGPFNDHGVPASASNRDVDAMRRARNPRSRPGVLHAYRASRAAQARPWRNVAVDLQQTHSQDCRVLLHPGTVDTARSRPSQTKVPEGTRFSTERATGRLLGIIAGLGATDSSRFIAWDGGDIPG